MRWYFASAWPHWPTIRTSECDFRRRSSLGGVDDPEVRDACVRIALRDANDHWMRAAALATDPQTLPALLEAVLDAPHAEPDAGRLALVRELTQTIGSAGDEDAIRHLLTRVATSHAAADEAFAREALLGFGTGLSRRGKRLADVIGSVPGTSDWIAGVVRSAQVIAPDAGAPVVDRRQAIELLGQLDGEALRAIAGDLLAASQPAKLQLAVLHGLSQSSDSDAPALVASAYRGLSPAVRRESIQTLLSRSSWAAELLDTVASGLIPAADIPRSRRAPLIRHTDPAVRQQAAAIFERDVLSPRSEVIADFSAALEHAGDAARGKQAFTRCCRTCHRLGGDGFDVGPSLSTVRHRTKAELMLSILDPNREVTAEFVEYMIQTRDGRIVTGAIGAETPTSITLRRAEGAIETVLRQDIEAMSTGGKSIMPEGFEKQLSLQQMADLLAYLSAGG